MAIYASFLAFSHHPYSWDTERHSAFLSPLYPHPRANCKQCLHLLYVIGKKAGNISELEDMSNSTSKGPRSLVWMSQAVMRKYSNGWLCR